MGKTSGSRRAGRPKGSGKKRKAVLVKFIHRKTEANGKITEPYRIMEEIIRTRRADLKDVKIGIAWRLGWRPDADGKRTLGQCRKRGDLDRELDSYDFIILLNEDAWPTFNDRQKERLMFHELGHAQLSLDANGQPKRDDRNRLICRIRKHEIQDFRDVVEIYGWEEDLQELAEKGIADAQRPLLAEAEKKAAEKLKATEGLATESTENTEKKNKRKTQNAKRRTKKSMAEQVDAELAAYERDGQKEAAMIGAHAEGQDED
jgi:hypothetical protein